MDLIEVAELHKESQMIDEDPQPIIVNLKAPGDLKKGDYVFASRWTDCSPSDPWFVGHVSEVGDRYVVIAESTRRQWPNAMRITAEQGRRIIDQFPAMEDGPQASYEEIAKIFLGPEVTGHG